PRGAGRGPVVSRPAMVLPETGARLRSVGDDPDLRMIATSVRGFELARKGRSWDSSGGPVSRPRGWGRRPARRSDDPGAPGRGLGEGAPRGIHAEAGVSERNSAVLSGGVFDDSDARPGSSRSRLYLDRVAGGDRDHRRVDRAAAAGGAGGP